MDLGLTAVKIQIMQDTPARLLGSKTAESYPLAAMQAARAIDSVALAVTEAVPTSAFHDPDHNLGAVVINTSVAMGQCP